MNLTTEQIDLLKQLMTNSALKGNLANAGLVIENDKTIASAESLVVTNHDATAHSERMLVSIVGKLKKSNYTPKLTMVTVVEPCLMCMSACSQAGYSKIAFIIPAKKYNEKMPWISDSMKIDKFALSKQFSEPVELEHITQYEEDFCQLFEKLMAQFLK